MKIYLVLLLSLVFSSFGFAGPASAPFERYKAESKLPEQFNNGFHVQNKPIKPQCVAQLNILPDDHNPNIATVDVTGCQNSLRNQQGFYTNGEDSFKYYYSQKRRSNGSFTYQMIGRTSNGMYVIKTIDRRKNKKYTSVQVLKLGKDHVFYYQPDNLLLQKEQQRKQLNIRNRETMTLMAEVEGGLNCHFAIGKVSLRGNDVSVEFAIDAKDLTALKALYPKKITIDIPTEKKKTKACLNKAIYRYNLQSLGEATFVGLVEPAAKPAEKEAEKKAR